ncbi:MAG: hypothetical protein N7Q72_05760 [Spiroplasma sp. Tabriz.8]|nr:hypothetical protein [Spiroplasma sp. Tabriz.8]
MTKFLFIEVIDKVKDIISYIYIYIYIYIYSFRIMIICIIKEKS